MRNVIGNGNRQRPDLHTDLTTSFWHLKTLLTFLATKKGG